MKNGNKGIVAALAALLLSSTASANPYAYVAATTGPLTVVDTSTDQVAAVIAEIRGVMGVAASTAAGKVYVPSGDVVHVIDIATNTVIGTVSGIAGPGEFVSLFGVAVDSAGTRAYVVDQGNGLLGHVFVVDTATDAVIDVIDLAGYAPGLVAVSPAGDRLYVSTSANGFGTKDIVVVDVATSTIAATIPFGPNGFTEGIATSPDGGAVYFAYTYRDASAGAIDVESGYALSWIPLSSEWSSGAVAVAVSPDGQRLYVSNPSDTLHVVDTATLTSIASVTLPSPRGVAVHPAGDRIYVAGCPFGGQASFSVVNAQTLAVQTHVIEGECATSYGQFIASAAPVTHTLTIQVGGAGSGTIAGTAGVQPIVWNTGAATCAGTCTAEVPAGALVALSGTPLNPQTSTFVGFRRPYCDVLECDYADPEFMPPSPDAWSPEIYTFPVNADTTVDARFVPVVPTAFAVTVEVYGPGSGTLSLSANGAPVAWGASGPTCSGPTCVSDKIPAGAVVRLAATADAQTSDFQGFGVPYCEAYDCQAAFESDPEFIPPTYAWVQAWEFTIGAPAAFSAKFASQTLTFKVAGLQSTFGVYGESGTALSGPGAIPLVWTNIVTCGTAGACTKQLPTNAAVTLMPPTGGNGTGTFKSWSGACTGSGRCTVTMNAAKTVTANFGAYVAPIASYTLTTSVAGVAAADAASIRASITPGAGAYSAGTSVTLTAPATPAANGNKYRFLRWAGCDAASIGTATTPPTCTVRFGYNRTVTATYLQTYDFALTVIGGATASPGVALTWGGVTRSCMPGVCRYTIDRGTTVSLKSYTVSVATPTATLWAGVCSSLSGVGCAVSVYGDVTASATFP